MDEFIKIRIEELKVLRENVLQKQREELAKIDVRIDELKTMINSTGLAYASDDSVDIDTISKVANVLKEEPKPVVSKEKEKVVEKKESSLMMDDFEIEIEEETSKTKAKPINRDEVDLEAMLNAL